MTEVPLHAKSSSERSSSRLPTNPLPQLLQTPSGLALLELQGTINLPDRSLDEDLGTSNADGTFETPIGRLVFPLYDATEKDGGQGWMKRVWLYVGKHQRLTGEVKKLPKAIAIIMKRKPTDENEDAVEFDDEKRDELEIVEIVKYKIIFSTRPEPVGT